jgi:hypothetical protein
MPRISSGASFMVTIGVGMAQPKFALETLTSQSGLFMQELAAWAMSTKLDKLNVAMESISLAVMGLTNLFKDVMFLKKNRVSEVCKVPMAMQDSSFASMEGAQAM